MIKVMLIVILAPLTLYGISKSTKYHKIGYGLFVLYILSIFIDPVHEKISVYFETHELVAEIHYVYIFGVLSVYCIIGVIEGLVRSINNNFTFSTWITTRLKRHRRDVDTVGIDRVNLQNLDFEKLEHGQKSYFRKNSENLDDEEIEEKSNLIESIEMFSLNKRFWDHEIELDVYMTLKDFLTNDYVIIPHSTFSNIFWWSWDKTDWKITNRVTKTHFDFAIYDSDFHPIFLMEVNGGTHELKPNKIELDQFKTLLSEKVGLKLISIDASKTIVNIQKEVKERIRQEFPDRASCPVYCPECKSSILMRLELNYGTKKYYYRCQNKECGVTHSVGKSGEYKKIAPLYSDMSDKLIDE